MIFVGVQINNFFKLPAPGIEPLTLAFDHKSNSPILNHGDSLTLIVNWKKIEKCCFNGFLDIKPKNLSSPKGLIISNGLCVRLAINMMWLLLRIEDRSGPY